MTDPVNRNNRAPYTVTYLDLKGELKTLKRVPPAALHSLLPTDMVELKVQKNDTFKEGQEFEVKAINPRSPNTIQLVNQAGETSFVEYYDVKLVEENAARDDIKPIDQPKKTRYLRWP